MPRRRRQIVDTSLALEIAHGLDAVEKSIDVAMQQAARFTAQLIDARGRAGLSIGIGQDALETVSAAITTIAQARRKMMQAHEHLAQDQRTVGIRPNLGGPYVDKPEEDDDDSIRAPALTVVGDVAA